MLNIFRASKKQKFKFTVLIHSLEEFEVTGGGVVAESLLNLLELRYSVVWRKGKKRGETDSSAVQSKSKDQLNASANSLVERHARNNKAIGASPSSPGFIHKSGLNSLATDDDDDESSSDFSASSDEEDTSSGSQATDSSATNTAGAHSYQNQKGGGFLPRTGSANAQSSPRQFGPSRSSSFTQKPSSITPDGSASPTPRSNSALVRTGSQSRIMGRNASSPPISSPVRHGVPALGLKRLRNSRMLVYCADFEQKFEFVSSLVVDQDKSIGRTHFKEKPITLYIREHSEKGQSRAVGTITTDLAFFADVNVESLIRTVVYPVKMTNKKQANLRVTIMSILLKDDASPRLQSARQSSNESNEPKSKYSEYYLVSQFVKEKPLEEVVDPANVTPRSSSSQYTPRRNIAQQIEIEKHIAAFKQALAKAEAEKKQLLEALETLRQQDRTKLTELEALRTRFANFLTKYQNPLISFSKRVQLVESSITKINQLVQEGRVASAAHQPVSQPEQANTNSPEEAPAQVVLTWDDLLKQVVELQRERARLARQLAEVGTEMGNLKTQVKDTLHRIGKPIEDDDEDDNADDDDDDYSSEDFSISSNDDDDKARRRKSKRLPVAVAAALNRAVAAHGVVDAESDAESEDFDLMDSEDEEEAVVPATTVKQLSTQGGSPNKDSSDDNVNEALEQIEKLFNMQDSLTAKLEHSLEKIDVLQQRLESIEVEIKNHAAAQQQKIESCSIEVQTDDAMVLTAAAVQQAIDCESERWSKQLKERDAELARLRDESASQQNDIDSLLLENKDLQELKNSLQAELQRALEASKSQQKEIESLKEALAKETSNTTTNTSQTTTATKPPIAHLRTTSIFDNNNNNSNSNSNNASSYPEDLQPLRTARGNTVISPAVFEAMKKENALLLKERTALQETVELLRRQNALAQKKVDKYRQEVKVLQSSSDLLSNTHAGMANATTTIYGDINNDAGGSSKPNKQ